MSSKLVTLVALFAASVVVSSATAGPRTTMPVVAYKAPAVINDRKATIFGRATMHLPRGAVIRFNVTNNGTHAYKAEVGLNGKYHFNATYESGIKTLYTAIIPPGMTKAVTVFFYYRSTFRLQALLDGKPHGAPAVITVT